MREVLEPTVTQERIGKCDAHDVLDHDAFGTIVMTTSTCSGKGQTLFGSDLPHGQQVHITINRARKHRDLSRDWIHSTDRIVDFSMSHAQFAQFITSTGIGGGTPITLNYAPAPGTFCEPMHQIQNPETKHETFRREIADAARRRLEDMRTQVSRLGAILSQGKVGMKDLRELHKALDQGVSYLPGTMEFVVRQSEEALEKASHDAMIDIEAFAQTTAQRLGLESIQELAALASERRKLTHNGG